MKIRTAITLRLIVLLVVCNSVLAQDGNIIVTDISKDTALMQTGRHNTISLHQLEQQSFVIDPVVTVAPNNLINIQQQGDLNLLDLLLEGSRASIAIMQTGINNQIRDETGAAMPLIGDSISLSILQTGNNNLVTGSMLGPNVANITQLGDNNIAAVSQR